jgi:hypothetical protein
VLDRVGRSRSELIDQLEPDVVAFELTPGVDLGQPPKLGHEVVVVAVGQHEPQHRTDTPAASLEVAEARPGAAVVWGLIMDLDRGPEMFPTLTKAETLTGSVDQVGSVHTCLHGDGMHAVHYRLAVDEANHRATDRLTGIPVVGRMIQTWEAKPSGEGTRFSFFYSPRPEAEITDEGVRRAVIETIRNHAERDVQGVKALCEAEYRARG